uniref:Uncharacterized protein n=1 Tax=Monopterus albus TaxID=43700 RepID=A0A3Q3JCJ3_MONAL
MGKTLRILLSASKCPPSRCCSSFVSRMRYVNRLKEDEAACVAALQYSRVFLFHRLSPLLQRTERGTFTPALILERLGSDGSLLKDSVLIGCSEQNQPQFCLDSNVSLVLFTICRFNMKPYCISSKVENLFDSSGKKQGQSFIVIIGHQFLIESKSLGFGIQHKWIDTGPHKLLHSSLQSQKGLQ